MSTFYIWGDAIRGFFLFKFQLFILGRVNINSSLFHYEFGQTYDSFNDRSFVPVFPSMEDLNSPEAVAVCGSNLQCLFDYEASGGDKTLALQTMQNVQIHQTILQNTKPGNTLD